MISLSHCHVFSNAQVRNLDMKTEKLQERKTLTFLSFPVRDSCRTHVHNATLVEETTKYINSYEHEHDYDNDDCRNSSVTQRFAMC